MRSNAKSSSAFKRKAGALKSSPTPNRPSTLFSKLDGYQQDAVRFALRAQKSALFFEQGTGKTWICGGVIEHLTAWGLAKFNALVIVPLTNIESTWAKFFREQLPHVYVCLSWEEFLRCDADHVVLLLHYEAVPPVIKKLRKWAWSFIAYDESQRLKNRGSITSRTAAKLHDSAIYKLILSGTPMDEAPQELWAQFRFINRDVLGESWKEFEDIYLEPVDIDLSKYRKGSWKWQMMLRKLQIARRKRPFNFDMLPDFLERVQPHALRVTKDVLDLPPCNLINAPVTLRGQQRIIYEELEHDLVSEVVNTSAPLKVTKIGKLQQVCGGHVIDDDGEVHQVGRAKMRKLKGIVNAHAGEPLVVFCKYLEEVASIAAELRISINRVETITGKVKHRAPIVADFQAGKIDVLVCQIKTGGVGIDLFHSHVAVIYSPTYSWIDFDQAISRLHRRGQRKPVSVYLLYAAETIDEDIYAALRSKRRVTTRVLNTLRRRRQNGKGSHLRCDASGQRPRPARHHRPHQAA